MVRKGVETGGTINFLKFEVFDSEDSDSLNYNRCTELLGTLLWK